MMNNFPLISVIVPVYNVENYLDQCIISIINQTYKNIEILIIDDGSTDNSSQKCDEYIKKDNRIKVFHKTNTGLGFTRNYGMKKSSGKYIMFVDSDDYTSKNTIEFLYLAILKYNCDTSISGYIKVDNEGNEIYKEHYNNEIFKNIEIKNKLLPRMIGSLPDIHDSIFCTSCAKLYSVDIINKNNLKFYSEREIQSEDLAFQMDYFRYSSKVVVIKENLYYYRTNFKSLSMKYKENRFTDLLKVYSYIYGCINKYNLPDSTFLRLDKMLFVQTLSCILQETPSVNKKSRKQCIQNINIITNNMILQNVINDYPIKRLNLKQKIYLFLLKFKMNKSLFFISKILGTKK